MLRRIRVIPVLLIQNGGLVKSIKFKNHRYIGDPINAVKIFNEKEVDEIVIIDISATKEKRKPNLEQIREITAEAFMPLSYGGGITSLEEARDILYEGAEKVILNTSALDNQNLISQIADQFGSQSVTVSIDVKKDWLKKHRIYRDNGTKKTRFSIIDFARKMELAGAGEIIITSIDRDGTYMGFDNEIIKQISESVNIPIIANGGASKLKDFSDVVIKSGASAVAAGSMFVLKRPHQAVLISYPTQDELISFFKEVDEKQKNNI